MRIWVINVGEPMAVDPGSERLLRMSLVAQKLGDLGHDVLWWSSTFDHNYKRQRFDRDTVVPLNDRLVLHFLHASAYSANISLRRLINHHQLARGFERNADAAEKVARPDVIFVTVPTVELAAAAARYGRQRSIPVIVDVRDLHPDIYLSLVPAWARPLARVALFRMYRELRTALRLASAVVAIAPSFLAWALRHAGRPATARDAVYPLAYPSLSASPEAVSAGADDLRGMGVRADRKIVWYVGTFNRWIDLETPIEAARMLANAGRDDVQLVISGSGDFDPEWRRLAASLPNVVFTGWIGVPHIVHMRGIAWVGLAPYRSGFLTVGNKLFEYMAGGLPILLSIEGDARSIIDRHNCGLTYESGNPETLIRAIDAMTADGVHQRMSTNSLRAYREHYSAEKVYGEMAGHIVGLANQGVDAVG